MRHMKKLFGAILASVLILAAFYAYAQTASQKQIDVVTSGTPGTVTALSSALEGNFMVLADATNTDNVTIGPTSAANLYTMLPGGGFNIPGNTGIAGWYVKSASASQSVHILNYRQ